MAIFTCPHCGRQFVPVGGNCSNHVRMCPEQPQIFESVRAALTDPDRPGSAVPVYEYNQRRLGTIASSTSTLLHAYGNWTNVCARFGLGLRRAKSEGLDAPLTMQERHACALRGMAERAYTER